MKVKSIFERKDNCLTLIAYASLKNAKESTDDNNIQAEKSRIERIAEPFYKNAIAQEYNSFMLDWLKRHAKEIVYEQTFCYDQNIQDEFFELDVNKFIK